MYVPSHSVVSDSDLQIMNANYLHLIGVNAVCLLLKLG